MATRSRTHRNKNRDGLEAVVWGLALGLLLSTLWLYSASFGKRQTASPAAEPYLTLSLSGTLTTDSRLSARDLAGVRCTPTGFHVTTSPSHAPFAMNVSFKGAKAAGAAHYLLGAGVGPLTLRLRTLDAAGRSVPGPVFTSVEGSVTLQKDVRRFAATMVDDHGRPLYLSGLLRCPLTQA